MQMVTCCLDQEIFFSGWTKSANVIFPFAKTSSWFFICQSILLRSSTQRIHPDAESGLHFSPFDWWRPFFGLTALFSRIEKIKTGEKRDIFAAFSRMSFSSLFICEKRGTAPKIVSVTFSGGSLLVGCFLSFFYDLTTRLRARSTYKKIPGGKNKNKVQPKSYYYTVQQIFSFDCIEWRQNTKGEKRNIKTNKNIDTRPGRVAVFLRAQENLPSLFQASSISSAFGLQAAEIKEVDPKGTTQARKFVRQKKRELWAFFFFSLKSTPDCVRGNCSEGAFPSLTKGRRFSPPLQPSSPFEIWDPFPPPTLPLPWRPQWPVNNVFFRGGKSFGKRFPICRHNKETVGAARLFFSPNIFFFRQVQERKVLLSLLLISTVRRKINSGDF